MDPTSLVVAHPWIGVVAVALFAVSEALASTPRVRANGVLALVVDIVRAVAGRLRPPPPPPPVEAQP